MKAFNNPDDVIRLHQAGMTVNKIADTLGISTALVYKIRTAYGIRTSRKIDLPIDDIISEFNAGTSIKTLAAKHSISRDVLIRRFNELGITTRSISESMYIRMANTDAKGRSELTAKAHETVRNKSAEYFKALQTKGAFTKAKTMSKVGFMEGYVSGRLLNAGFKPIGQLPVGTYNIDIACGLVAVEIHNRTDHPHSPECTRKRIITLLKSGWFVLYVKLNRQLTFNEVAMNKIVKACQLARLDPTPEREYWMIRSTGELFAAGRLNGDDLTLIPTSESLLND